MEVFLFCSAAGTTVRQTLTASGSYEGEDRTVLSFHVVLCDPALFL